MGFDFIGVRRYCYTFCCTKQSLLRTLVTLNPNSSFIKRDTKLKDLERNDCDDYFYSRTKTTKKLKVSQTMVQNEQSSINALMAWLYKNKLTHIEAFDFKKLPRVDKGNEALRRSTFTDDEIREIKI